MSRFTDKMFHSAKTSSKGMVTGEPHEPVRHTWGEVHERARRIAGGLAAAGVGHGDAVGVLAGAPVEIAPTAQGLWIRGASLTMLHQPTPRTDLAIWAQDTTNVIDMIDAKAVVISEPFLAAAPVLADASLRRGLDPVPYLLGLACAANVGSAATLIGNPQNMLIGETLRRTR